MVRAGVLFVAKHRLDLGGEGVRRGASFGVAAADHACVVPHDPHVVLRLDGGSDEAAGEV